MSDVGAAQMTELGIVQHPNSVLSTPTRAYDLPAESELALKDWQQLVETADAVFALYQTKKGLGVAAPQIGITRRIAIMRPFDEPDICLLNAEIVGTSDETDVRYEGCLSLFDVRGEVERPLQIRVCAQEFNGETWQRTFTNATARLVCHELDHLDGRLYIDRMTHATISVESYRKLSNTDWIYS